MHSVCRQRRRLLPADRADRRNLELRRRLRISGSGSWLRRRRLRTRRRGLVLRRRGVRHLSLQRLLQLRLVLLLARRLLRRTCTRLAILAAHLELLLLAVLVGVARLLADALRLAVVAAALECQQRQNRQARRPDRAHSHANN